MKLFVGLIVNVLIDLIVLLGEVLGFFEEHPEIVVIYDSTEIRLHLCVSTSAKY